jgi:hypothetical protein
MNGQKKLPDYRIQPAKRLRGERDALEEFRQRMPNADALRGRFPSMAQELQGEFLNEPYVYQTRGHTFAVGQLLLNGTLNEVISIFPGEAELRPEDKPYELAVIEGTADFVRLDVTPKIIFEGVSQGDGIRVGERELLKIKTSSGIDLVRKYV